MRIENLEKEKLNTYFKNLDSYIKTRGAFWVKYLDLGPKTVRLLGFCDEFLPHIEKQVPYILRNSAEKFDTTIVLFKDDFENFAKIISEDFNPKTNLSLRVKMLASRQKELDLYIIDKNYSKINPVFHLEEKRGFLNAFNRDKNTYYYGVKNLEPEEFIKEGHIFIQFFNRILKDERTNVIHGALIGLNNTGILFCARGQRGKSTLCTLSIVRGFEYVSDDYLTLQKEGETLYSYPIYSIITLSPYMYNKLYNELKDSRFVSNNARKDKYVFNIENFHDKFKTKYPVKFCLFPEIVPDKNPSIVPCTPSEKGRAIVQMIQSTVSQMQDLNNTKTIEKLFNMVKDFNFYKINLSLDIEKNTKLLKEFTKNYTEEKLNQTLNERMLIDITFNYANIIDTKTMTILYMNKTMTNIYENLLTGKGKGEIINTLKKDPKMPENIEKIINGFYKILRERGLLKKINNGAELNVNFDFIKEENYNFSFIEYGEDETIELITTKENTENELCA